MAPTTEPTASKAKKVVLPEFTLTQVSDGPVDGAELVTLFPPGQKPVSYYTVPTVNKQTGARRDNKPQWIMSTYRLFPVVLCGDGSPWAEANLCLLGMLETKVMPKMLTFASIAEDLAAFRRYIEEEVDLDWLNFVAHKPRRPTYRYSAALRIAVQSGGVSASVAKRRMATVIRFYRWLMSEGGHKFANAPWSESDRFIHWKDAFGFSGGVTVTTTDVSIRSSTAEDPWDDCIVDGGSLRPLPQNEQKVLLEILTDLANTEMSLIHHFSLLSGARSQTVLTVRVRHFERNPDEISGEYYGLKAGPGTGIDTKGGKRGVLHVPKWFYERLHIYANSERARCRRLKAEGGDHGNQLLFLSRNGAPFYEPQERLHQAQLGGPPKRYAKAGQAVRQFNKDKLLPEMRRRLNNRNYKFSFHDLRATFGMNTVDSMASLIDSERMTNTQALDQLRQLMWHTSVKTTEDYIRYRKNRAGVAAADDGWHRHLASLIQSVAKQSGSDSAED